MDRFELRRLDYSLSEDHTDLQSAYRQFFKTHCGIETVWAAEGSGFDKSLWERLCATGATTMALPESVGGDGATLVDLTLVAEELGRAIAPAPWIDHVCTTRLLAALGALSDDSESVALDQRRADRLPRPSASAGRGGKRLIPAGSVADHVVIRDGDDVVRLSFDTRPTKVDNIGRLPMAWIDPAAADQRVVLASGADAVASYQRALDEWRVLMAAPWPDWWRPPCSMRSSSPRPDTPLACPSPRCKASRTRWRTSRSPSRAVATSPVARPGSWTTNPTSGPNCAASAFVFMAHEAPRAATMAVHVQGGLGVSAEAASSAYLLRARGWALAGGDPAASAKQIAELVWSSRSRVYFPGRFAPALRSRTEQLTWTSPEWLCPTRIRTFQDELRSFLAELVTDEVIRRDRETGENFDEDVHLALGGAGYLESD